MIQKQKTKAKEKRKPQTNVQEPKLPKLKREANSKLSSTKMLSPIS
jgi:hypothetical protein